MSYSQQEADLVRENRELRAENERLRAVLQTVKARIGPYRDALFGPPAVRAATTIEGQAQEAGRKGGEQCDATGLRSRSGSITPWLIPW